MKRAAAVPTPRGFEATRRPPPRREPMGDARAAAAWVVERTLASLAPADTFLADVIGRFEDKDQGFLRELVLGTLRWLGRIDHVVAAASSRPLAQIEPALLAPLRIAAYQLLFLDRVPAHAVVHEAVSQAARVTHRGGASFTNAVLRRIARSPELTDWPITEGDEATRLAVELSHPVFLVRRYLERLGPRATRALLLANNQPKPFHVMAFRDRGGRELLAEDLIDAGLEVEASRVAPLGLVVRSGNPLTTPSFRRGDFYIQDEAGQAAALVPPPRPGERVLDAAAAPGGKSLALLAFEPRVKLVAADISPARLALLRQNLGRLRRQVPMLAADAGAPALSGSFDRVILDLPCSGTGTFRKHPELKWRVSEGEIGRLAQLGQRLLDGVADLVAPEGLLIAVTCSLEREENEDVIARFRERRSGFEPVALSEQLGQPTVDWVRGEGLWRIPTAGDHDGFTVQALRRVAP
ncbi:MAG TPA: transcription antitermination factor NusB [Thermoanaerobaculia bacterium]|nr:transcription antitermination factor NusB [Thermoanaerobaculia bacterium]